MANKDEDYTEITLDFNKPTNVGDEEIKKIGKSPIALTKNLLSPFNPNSSAGRKNSSLDPSSIPTFLKRNSSFSTVILNKNERRVLVIYTGGTIGMTRSSTGSLVPLPNMLEKTIRKFPHLHDENYGRTRFGEFSPNQIGETPLVLPEIPGEAYRIVYTIFEYDPLLDSSQMTMDDWINIAMDIKENYEAFDGFVILHGTDTLSYTASALSFMLEHLGKTVCITGSQIPLFETRSDGRDNFLGGLILAGAYVIPEVICFFSHKGFRGNRVTKISSECLMAFDSPNMPPLATMGINIQIDFANIFRPRDISAFSIHTNLNRNVGLLRLFPSITTETVKIFLHPPTMGVVIQTYGAGNFPSNRKDMIEELKKASERGVIMVNCTQCANGSVSAIYQTGEIIQDAGVIPGWDLTPEAALVKLSYILGRDDWNLEKKKEMFQTNLRGELTKFQKPQNALTVTKREFMSDYGGNLLGDSSDVLQKIVKIISQSLGLSTQEEIEAIKKNLVPALTCALIVHCSESNFNMKNLEALFGKSDPEIGNGDYSGRTPLHIAVALNDVLTSEFLLKKGASVYIRDNKGFSPLREAIEFDSHQSIKLLRKCGAHLSLENTAIGAELCMAACKGDAQRLKSYMLAGANINQKDPCGRNALHAATEAGHVSTVQWLIQHGAELGERNILGKTALEIALLLKNNKLIDILLQTPKSPNQKQKSSKK